ncbi:MAG: cadherin repeat domain-containing protein, partial [Clostridiales Family XIII bacterium]|nr:cadherin repeat domain-containing protein [Clostridiales Family XIII bacterium]
MKLMREGPQRAGGKVRKLRNRLLAGLLTAAMLVTFMPSLAFADAPADPTPEIVTVNDLGDMGYLDNRVGDIFDDCFDGTDIDDSYYRTADTAANYLNRFYKRLKDLVELYYQVGPAHDWGGNDAMNDIKALFELYKNYYGAVDKSLDFVQAQAEYDLAVKEFGDALKDDIDGNDSTHVFNSFNVDYTDAPTSQLSLALARGKLMAASQDADYGKYLIAYAAFSHHLSFDFGSLNFGQEDSAFIGQFSQIRTALHQEIDDNIYKLATFATNPLIDGYKEVDVNTDIPWIEGYPPVHVEGTLALSANYNVPEETQAKAQAVLDKKLALLGAVGLPADADDSALAAAIAGIMGAIDKDVTDSPAEKAAVAFATNTTQSTGSKYDVAWNKISDALIAALEFDSDTYEKEFAITRVGDSGYADKAFGVVTTGGKPSISYSIVSAPAGDRIRINRSTGIITVNKDTNSGLYKFNVRATDSFSPPYVATASVSLTVTNAYDKWYAEKYEDMQGFSELISGHTEFIDAIIDAVPAGETRTQLEMLKSLNPAVDFAAIWNGGRPQVSKDLAKMFAPEYADVIDNIPDSMWPFVAVFTKGEAVDTGKNLYGMLDIPAPLSTYYETLAAVCADFALIADTYDAAKALADF